MLDGYFYNLTANRFLEDKITGSILSEDEIADSASPELADIRRHIRAAAGKVRDVLNRLISSNQSKYLQEAIITMRGGRYVVPVKSEHKNDIPGLVHDVSGSGGTFFIEPMGVVNANNELRELQAREEKEIERILAELSADCAGFQDDIAQDYQLLVALDAIFARGKLSSRMGAMRARPGGLYRAAKGPAPPIGPQDRRAQRPVSGERLRHSGDHRPQHRRQDRHPQDPGPAHPYGPVRPAHPRQRRLYHPGVLHGAGGHRGRAVHRPVPVHLLLSHGKHRGHFGAGRRRDALILFDELGAGTDPVEGAALAAAIIESARGMGALVAATTHYAELKVYAMTTAGVENASCEFDVETLAPTYRVLIGMPGKSNAFAISRRLGLPDSHHPEGRRPHRRGERPL